MEKLSRTKKYQDLRDQLQNDGESTVESSDLNEYANRLNRINADEFKSVEEPKYPNTNPLHEKKVENINYFEDVNFPTPPKSETYQSSYDSVSSSFNNEYMDDYLNEVKQYNKDRGYAKEADTTLNILEELKSRNEPGVSESSMFDIDSIIEANKYMDDDLNLPFSFGLDNDVSQLTDEVRNLVADEPVSVQSNTYFEKETNTYTPNVFEEFNQPTYRDDSQDTKLFTAPISSHYEEPIVQHQYSEPKKPIYEEPVYKPQYEEPVARPQYQEPVVKPYSEPVARPQYEEPVVRPYAEPANSFNDINRNFNDVDSQKSAMAQAVENELRKEEDIKIKTDVVVEEPKKKPVATVTEDDDYDDEKGGTANKILNVILFILIIALLIVLGVVVYWTLLNRGVI